MSHSALLVAAVAALVLAVPLTSTASAAPAKVPCSSAGAGKFNCEWRVPGNGTSGGSPVLDSAGKRVGYLHQGTNYITCQAVGRTERDGSYFNNAWGRTVADNGKAGWVNAVWARGGDNNGGFSSAPRCTSGSPPRTVNPTSPSTPAPSAPTAAPAPVPCRKASRGRHNCQWRVPGNGRSGGSPVLSANGKRVGYLHQGTNYVTCQATGRTERSGGFFNNVWGYTVADNHKRGWVSALWASGGANNGGFSGTPACAASVGRPPSTGRSATPPASRPAPKPRAVGKCTQLHEDQYATVGFSFYETRRHYVYSNVGTAPGHYDYKKPANHDYGKIVIGAVICKDHKVGWRLANPLSITTSSVGLFKDAGHKVKVGGSGSARGWGVGIVGGGRSYIDVQSTVCAVSTGAKAYLNDLANIASIPIPGLSFAATVTKFLTVTVGRALVNKYVPGDSTKCSSLGVTRFSLTATEAGRLRVTPSAPLLETPSLTLNSGPTRPGEFDRYSKAPNVPSIRAGRH